MSGVAEGTAAAILGKLAENLVAPIGRQFRYLFCYNSIINNLRNEVNELKLMRDGEQMRFDEATNNVQAINPLVGDWLNKVGEISRDSEIILDDSVNMWCPNLKSRYLLGRRATKKTQEVVDLKRKGKFDWVSCHAAPLATVVPTSTTYNSSTGFESRKSTVEEIIVALKDVEINVIGISGMGGVGKTTMVDEVRARVKEEGLFNEVAMAVVSQSRDFLKIQGELGDELSLRFDEMVSVRARADKLRTRLMINGRRILVILDDLWEGLDLGKVGIPVGGDCKVLLTSRIERVCQETGTQKNFVVQVLSNEEAWDLFKAKAGNCLEDDFDLHSIAKEVAEECCGLPIAIVTLASALKGREEYAWRDALRQLRNSNVTNIPGMHEKVYSSIELSYNFLKSDQAKALLLFCCQFREDTRLRVDTLVELAMGLRIFDDIDTLVAKRDRVSSLVDELKNCHLLLDVTNWEGSSVMLHDVIRDVGISIASKQGKVFLSGFDTNLKEWSRNDMHKRYTALCLRSSEIVKFPDGLDFSMLEHLIVNCEYLECTGLGSRSRLSRSRLRDTIPLLRDPFEKMKHLRVAAVSDMQIESVAQSLQYLTNLSTLLLQNCDLRADMSFTRSMQNLEILSFRSSIVNELPSSIGQLGNLKSLDLRCETGPEIIPFGVLSGLKKLEELYMGKYFLHAPVEDDEDERGNGGARVEELNLLPRLNTLQITFSDPEVMKKLKNFPFENLKRFDFDMRDNMYDSSQFSTRVSLSKINASAVSETNVSVLVRKAAQLIVYELENLKNIFEDLYSWRSALNQRPSLANLKYLQLSECHAIKGLFLKPIVKCLVELQHLYIINCKLVEEVVSKEAGEGKEDSENIIFPRLQTLCLEDLPKFRSIYAESEDIFGTLNNRDAGNIQTLFNQQVMLPSLEDLVVNSLPKLLNVAASDEILSLQNLQRLRVFCCDSVEVVFDFTGLKVEGEPKQILLGQLTTIRLLYLPKLAHIWRMVPKGIQVFQTLTNLNVTGCKSLRYLLSPSMAKLLVNLQVLRVNNCSALEQIIMTTTCDEEEEQEQEQEAMCTIVFPQLWHLELIDLHNLDAFMITRIIKRLELPLLKFLVIKECNNMKNFCSEVVNVTTNLEEVRVWGDQRIPMGDLNDIIYQWVWLPHFDNFMQHLEEC